jgi:tetratricopeptide (TPR) repeat protein
MAYADLGRHADGVRALRAALALWPDARVREELVRALRLEAQALAALGQVDEAARRLDEARAVAGP